MPQLQLSLPPFRSFISHLAKVTTVPSPTVAPSFRSELARLSILKKARHLSEADWSWGCVSAVDSNGRTIWIADAHRGDGKRFVVHAEEKLTAFVELEAAIRVSEPIHIDIAGLGPETLRH